LIICGGLRNWLFSGIMEVSWRDAFLSSLIKNCQSQQTEPWGYFRYIFDRLLLPLTLEDIGLCFPEI